MMALAAAWLLGAALLQRPVVAGDGGEYALMTVSLARHLTPDARPADVQAIAGEAHDRDVPVNFVLLLRGYFATADGRQYSLHFWGYSLLAVPPRLILRAVGADPFKAHAVVNAVCLLAALWSVFVSGALDRTARFGLFALTLLSPALAFLRWPHPEVFTYSLVTLSLVWMAEGRAPRAILAAALGAMQNPPLVWLVAALWLMAWRRADLAWPPSPATRRRAWWCTVAAVPALVPPAFFYWNYGTPSLIARESASWAHASIGRVLELLFDLNLGLLPYLPVTLALFLVSVLAAALVRRTLRTVRLAALLLVLALSCSLTANWNHGTSGPSRYAIWLLPVVFMGVLALRANVPALGARPFVALLALAVASQAGIALARGGTSAPVDYLEHSYAARAALRLAPHLYNPSPEIFVTRTVHVQQPILQEPVAYRSDLGCRKALVRPQDRNWLEATCGSVPPDVDWFSGPAARDRGWQYVDYDRLPAGAGAGR